MAARLTFSLGVIALLVLSSAGVLLHRALTAEMTSADQSHLAGKLAAVRHLVDAAGRPDNLRRIFHDLDDLKIGHAGLGIWITRPSGERLYGDEPIALLGDRKALIGTAQAPADLVTAVLTDSSPWPGAVLSVAQSLQPREQLLRLQLATLLWVCAFGVIGSVSLSWIVVRHCLRPLRLLSAEASKISPRFPGKRLTIPTTDEELGALVQSINEVLGRLELAYAHLQAFNANVAHELWTPLASLMTGTQVALTRSQSPKHLQSALESNLEELSLLSSLVNDMLFLSRTDSGDRADVLERVSLGEVVDMVTSYCDALLQEAQISATRVGDATTRCNRPLIYRALVNLLTNAIRHTPSHGAIVVRVDSSQTLATVSVWNPGPAIDDAVRHQMFDRFYSTDATRIRGERGHGLGLAIVAAIARMHGGRVFERREGAMNGIGFELPLLS